MDDVIVYSNGIVCCSVCVSKKLSREEIEQEVELCNPAGTLNGWKISEDKTFNSGQENGCDCEDHSETRRHYLLDC